MTSSRVLSFDCRELRIDTKETGFFTLVKGRDAVFSQKTRFLTTRQPKKPGFWPLLRGVTKYSRKNPVSDYPQTNVG